MYKVSKWFAIIWTIICLVGCIAGLKNVSEIKPENDFQSAGAAIGTSIGMGMWIFIWFFPTVGAAVLAFLTKPKNKTVVENKTELCPNCGKYYQPPATFCPNCSQEIKKKS